MGDSGTQVPSNSVNAYELSFEEVARTLDSWGRAIMSGAPGLRRAVAARGRLRGDDRPPRRAPRTARHRAPGPARGADRTRRRPGRHPEGVAAPRGPARGRSGP